MCTLALRGFNSPPFLLARVLAAPNWTPLLLGSLARVGFWKRTRETNCTKCAATKWKEISCTLHFSVNLPQKETLQCFTTETAILHLCWIAWQNVAKIQKSIPAKIHYVQRNCIALCHTWRRLDPEQWRPDGGTEQRVIFGWELKCNTVRKISGSTACNAKISSSSMWDLRNFENVGDMKILGSGKSRCSEDNPRQGFDRPTSCSAGGRFCS